MKPIKLCIVGAGQFAQNFAHLFKAHPMVSEVSIAEVIAERRAAESKRLGIPRTFDSLESALAAPDIDAVALFTQRWMHAPMAIAAMRTGKHVYSAVPAATSLDELSELIDTVKQTGMTYMMGETSYYYGATVYCRQRWQQGDFGRFVYGEGEYLHDMSHGFYEAFQYSGGDRWKRTAGFPPMLYPTHSVAMILSVTGARMTQVSCIGQIDEHEDGIFRQGANDWNNVFSNQSALFRTSDGGMARMNEFRRVGCGGGRSVRMSLFGTKGTFEEMTGGASWSDLQCHTEDVEPLIKCEGVYSHEQWERIKVDVQLKGDFVSGFAQVHQPLRDRLPAAYRTQPNGHEGSHQFLADDFVTACTRQTTPTVSVWDAARYNAPGIVAHQSALKGGELLNIPDYPKPATA
ncbi:MAG: Gfo/Idh/MocA family oxidoreductase [Phycisphaerales bacterium]|nr:Gfo/Idh/MocA family oxidoreductase [Phycisphaerales bacterium]